MPKKLYHFHDFINFQLIICMHYSIKDNLADDLKIKITYSLYEIFECNNKQQWICFQKIILMTPTDKNGSKATYLEKNHFFIDEYIALSYPDQFCSKLRNYIFLSAAFN